MKLFLNILLFVIMQFSFCKSTPQMNLLQSVEKGKIEETRKLLNKENVNYVNSKKQNLLLIASRNNDVAMAKLFLEYGADVNQVDDISDSPFLYLGVSGNAELAKLYIDHGARFDIYNRYGGTALIPASERGHVELVKLLVHTPNYPINHINNLGWTALMEAVILGDGSPKYVDIVQILLEGGADKRITDSDGVSALQHAKQRNYKITRLNQYKVF